MTDILYAPPLPKVRRFDGKTELEALASLRDWCNRHSIAMLTPFDYTVTYKSSGVWIDIPENYGGKRN